MKVDIGRRASIIFKSVLMYVMSLALVLGSVSFAAPEFLGQVAYAATSYNGNVAGIITSAGGVVSGNLTGDYSLTVAGNVSSYVDNVATFSGTIAGDINGNVTAQINDNGVDTMAGLITGTDATEPVRIIGTFPQSGIDGDFVGQIITGPMPVLVDSIAINGEGGAITVEQGDDLQMIATVLPAEAENKNVAWSVYLGTGEAVIDVNTGELTGVEQGTVTVIAKSLDGSLKDATKAITVVAPTDHFAPTVGAIEVVDNSTNPMVDYNPYAKGDKKIRVRASVSDDQGDVQSGIDTTTCEITTDGTNWTPGTYNSTTGKCYGIILANTFTDGQIVSAFNVRISDIEGNVGTGTAVSRTVDSVAPVLGPVSVTPTYIDSMAGSVHVESDVTESVSGVTCEQRYWLNLNDGDSSDDWSDWVATNYDDGKCQLDIGGMTDDRVYQFEMRATDNVGHLSNVVASGPYLVDDVYPTVEFVSPTPQNNAVVYNNSQTFKVETSEDIETCTLDLGLGLGTFEDGSLAAWQTGGNAAWRIGAGNINGSYAAQSGSMAGLDNVQSWISRTVDVPYDTEVSFDWKVSSESGWDYLRFSVDNIQRSAISGSQDWSHVTFPISAGAHTLTWNYTKDGSVTRYEDSGWIDNVTVGGVDLGTVDSTMTNNGDGTWSYGPIILPEGTRNYSVTCIDYVGNSTTTAERSLTVDTVHPAVPVLDAPQEGEVISTSTPLFSWFEAGNAVGYVFQMCYNNPDTDIDGYCDEYTERSVESTELLLEDVSNGTYWWRVLSVNSDGEQSAWSATRSFNIDQTEPESYVDALSEYKNTEKFDINVIVDDHDSDAGVKYVELWYKKDGNSCPVVSDTEDDDCVDGYAKYIGASESGEFDPLEPIEFDTSLTGGDGFYEFFSIAVDWADNREDYPYNMIVLTLTGFVQQLLADEDSEEEIAIVADASTTVDTTAPVITLIGESEMTIVQGETFTDPGAETDDGSTVAVTGSVNTDILGTYTLTYDSTDAAGNVAESIIRTVNVGTVLPDDKENMSDEKENTADDKKDTSDDNDNQTFGYAPSNGGSTGDDGSSDTETGDDSEIKGTSDVQEKDKSDNQQDGMAWYWWLLILTALGGTGWWLLSGVGTNGKE